jgi:MinD-like ATPase involved in chromosome partitioning or flagellar assembly
MLRFLKNFLFRRFDLAAKKNKPVQNVLNQLFHHRSGSHQLTVKDIQTEITKVDAAAAKGVKETCADFRPIVIFNMGSHWKDLNLIKQFSRGLYKVLDMEADYLGFIFADKQVAATIKQRKPLLLNTPDSIAAKEIRQIAKRLIKFHDKGVENSGQLLIESTRKFFEGTPLKA